ARNPFLARGALPEPPGPPSGTSAGERPVPPRSIADSQRAVNRSLKESMQARIDKGIGPEGPVLHALHDATYGGFAPLVGSATFLAIVDANGLVVDLRLVRSHPRGKDADHGWEETRERAAEALATKKLALRGAGGAELRIEVESDLRFPSGRRATSFPVQPTFSQSRIDLPQSLPNAGLPGDSTVSYTIGTFDLTDLGATPRRVVHTRLVASREM
ncbi:MAG TPA: hypothetical protein VM925_03045, partial [Labilithrix sp.]|nr:hypothetical protein [Labilithrix sp.]